MENFCKQLSALKGVPPNVSVGEGDNRGIGWGYMPRGVVGYKRDFKKSWAAEEYDIKR